MNLTKCERGHFYDNDRFIRCPHCWPARTPTENFRIPQPQVNNFKVPSPAPVSPVRAPAPISGSVPYFVPAPPTAKNPIAIENNTSSVLNQKTELPYIFISYAHSDTREVTEIISFLKANHFNIWYDEGIKSGHEWADELSRRIKHCKQFICFISKNSINSESVKDEIHIAWKYNINTIVVYLEKVELDGGLEMKLDRKQAILKYALNEQDFHKKLSSSISQDVVNFKNNLTINDVGIDDKYEIIQTLSQGGTAKTYLARNKVTDVKVILKHGVYDDTISGQRIKRSFEKERAVLAKNISPFIPTLYDYFCDEKNVYIAESYIEGRAINELSYLSLYDKIELFIKAAKVIEQLHNTGIYHCDIKPEHIIVNQHGCFVIDLGSAEDSSATFYDDVKMGTVTYAAPEQFVSYNGENDIFGNYNTADSNDPSNKIIDERTDIYALGRVMVKVISGNNNALGVMDDASMTTVLLADVTKTISEFSDNPLLQAIIEKMVREKKSNRYKNMSEVIRVLEDFLKIYKK